MQESNNFDQILTVVWEEVVYVKVFEHRNWEPQTMWHPFHLSARLHFTSALVLGDYISILGFS